MSAPGARWVIFLAACIWHVGSAALLWRGTLLLLEAEGLDPGRGWPWLGIPAALLIGALKGRLLLVRAVLRNKARISALARPRPWHVYHPGFFLFLVANVLLARWVILWSEGHYVLTILCGTMLLSIGVALLVSSPAWWRPAWWRPASGSQAQAAKGARGHPPLRRAHGPPPSP